MAGNIKLFRGLEAYVDERVGELNQIPDERKKDLQKLAAFVRARQEAGEETTLTFIGTDTCVPQPDDDTASFLLNDHILVDCGWNAAINMSRFGHTPLDLDWVLITHCHQDHYLGLAGVIFYIGLRGQGQELAVGLVISLAVAPAGAELFPCSVAGLDAVICTWW